VALGLLLTRLGLPRDSFNKGGYHNALAGCSHLSNTGGQWQFSGYRRHDRDLLVFPSGGTRMTWRCGEPGAGGASATTCRVFSYVLVYEW